MTTLNKNKIARALEKQLKDNFMENIQVKILVADVIQATAIHEGSTEVAIVIFVNDDYNVDVTLHAIRYTNRVELVKHYFTKSEDNLVSLILSNAITSAILVETM